MFSVTPERLNNFAKASGYEVPEHETHELANGESLVIDYSLVPAANPQNN